MRNLSILNKRCSLIPQFIVVLLLMINGPQSFAQSCLVNSLIINTGYDPATSTVITGGLSLQDPKWEVSWLSSDLATVALPNVPVYNAYVNSTGYGATNPNSEWIGVIPTVAYTTTAAGPYMATFRRSFSTCFRDVITFNIDIANDNYCPEIRVDGIPVPPGSPFWQPSGPWPSSAMIAHYNSWTTISGFNMNLPAGTHTIEVDVVNLVADGDNPHGLNIVGTISCANTIIVDESPACTSYVCCNPHFNVCMNTADPYQVDFSADDATLSPSAYAWTIDYTSAGSGATKNHTFTSTGHHPVRLDVPDQHSGLDCPTKDYYVCILGEQSTGDPCELDFTYCYSTKSPYSYEFTSGNTSLSSSSYSWTVNGVSAGTGYTLNYTFSGPYTYEICLTMNDGQTVCERCIEICVGDNGAWVMKQGNKSSNETNVPKGNAQQSTSVADLQPNKFEVLKVYPNPAHDIINVECSNAGKGWITVKMYDVLGKLVVEHSYLPSRDQKVSIPTGKLAPGVYMMEVSNGSTTKRQKIVKE